MHSKPLSPFDDGFPRPPERRGPVAFCANLDADEELSDPRYQPRRALRERLRQRATSLVPSLLRPDDVLIDSDDGPVAARGLPGLCWCVTRRALERLEQAGTLPMPQPPLAVVARVNHRAFALSASDVVAPLCVHDVDMLAQHLATAPDAGHGFVAKPVHGFAGRGHRRLTRTLSEDDLRHLKRPLARGGILLEPWLPRELDCALHGFVTQDGRLRLGAPTVQTCDVRGAWHASVVAPPGALSSDECTRLRTSAEETGAALHAAGYFGPFGIDAFRYRLASGGLGFRPRVEINARYTMAWGLGFFAR